MANIVAFNGKGDYVSWMCVVHIKQYVVEIKYCIILQSVWGGRRSTKNVCALYVWPKMRKYDEAAAESNASTSFSVQQQVFAIVICAFTCDTSNPSFSFLATNYHIKSPAMIVPWYC